MTGDKDTKAPAASEVEVKETPEVADAAKDDGSPGPVKLFVGRFPRSMQDETLRALFERFGSVSECTVMRDASKQSKGCAFVKFGNLDEANAAIKDLNGKHEIEEALGCLQVQYATGEVERLGLPSDVEGAGHVKLFVGALPKSTTNESLKNLFQPYGQVAEACVLLDDRGNSKGSGFVRYATLECAQRAITALDQKQTLPGGTRAIEVRLAQSRTQRQMEAQRHGAPPAAAAAAPMPWGGAGTPFHPGMVPYPFYGYPGFGGYPMHMSPSMHIPPAAAAAMMGGWPAHHPGGMPSAEHGAHHHPGHYGPPAHMMMPHAMMSPHGHPHAAAAPGAQAPAGQAAAPSVAIPAGEPRKAGGWAEYFAQDGKAYYHHATSNVTQWDRPADFPLAAVAAAAR